MIRDRALVVGGGIGGMAAALLLADAGFQVDLFESGPRLGVGWRSVETPFGPADLGLRIPRESGNPRADALIFHADPSLAWHDLGPRPREGHVALGRLTPDTSCLDARALPALAQARAEVVERADTLDPGAAAPHLAARWHATFGPTLLEGLLRPACRVTLGAEPEALAPTAADSRIPTRVVLFDTADTDRLHRLGTLATRLAHPRASDAPNGDMRRYLYPREGGIGRWVTAMESSLPRARVRVHTGARIASLRRIGARVTAVRLEDGAELPLDLLLLAASPRAIPGTPPIPDSGLAVTARLLLFRCGAHPDLHWIASYDPATPFLRVGFVDHLEGREPVTAWRVIAELRDGAPCSLFREAEGSTPKVSDARVGAATPPPTTAGWGGGSTLQWLRNTKCVGDHPLGTGRFAVETLATAAARHAATNTLHGHTNLHILRSAAGGHALAGDLIADAARLVARVTSTPLAA